MIPVCNIFCLFVAKSAYLSFLIVVLNTDIVSLILFSINLLFVTCREHRFTVFDS